MSIASLNPGPPRSGLPATTPSVAAPVAAVATPSPADKTPAPANPAPSRFADLLRRSRNDAPAPAAAAPVATPSPADEPADAVAPRETATIEAKAAPANAAKARAATSKGAGAKTAGVDDGAKASGNVWVDVDGEGIVRRGADGEAPAAAAIAAPACSVTAAPTAPVVTDAWTPLRRGVSPEGDESGDGGALASARDSAASPPSPTIAVARDDAKSERQVGAAGEHASIAAAAEPSVLAAFADVAPRAGDAEPRPAHRSIDAIANSFAAGPAPHALDPSSHAAATVTALATPIDSPDFAAALGVQVSVLAKDGVQQAELHLNPNELGPVSIHISLDGSAARVDFGADVAATREAIERGLPELASALQDAGFTLAGGGVSQHAGGRPAGEDDRASRSRRVDATGAALAAPTGPAAGRATRRVAAGGVDLYA